MGSILAFLIVLPLVAALVCWLMQDRQARWFATGVALAELAMALTVVLSRHAVVWKQVWMPSLGINLDLRTTAANVLLLILTPLLTALALMVTARSTERLNEYSGHLLLLMASLEGLFLADNLGVFYIFFELMLLPTLLLTARWGGDLGRKASLKFLLYTLAGSLPMLLGIISLAYQGGTPDLSFESLAVSPELQQSLFWLFLLAFVVKVPLFPFHGWLVDLYSSAPAPVVAVVAGAMSKAGLYGMIRVLLGLFPDASAQYAPLLSGIALFSLLYGGACALGAPTTRSLLAFSSLSHLGLMVVAVFAGNQTALDSSLLQMFSHGICTGGLFLVLAILEARGLPSRLSELGGLARFAPQLAALFQVLAMGSLGCPGLCSFPGELGMIAGIYLTSPLQAVLAILSVILAAWYLLRLFQGTMHGLPFAGEDAVAIADVSTVERSALLTLCVLAFWVGFLPSFWLDLARLLPWN